jgi:hypothetical protein
LDSPNGKGYLFSGTVKYRILSSSNWNAWKLQLEDVVISLDADGVLESDLPDHENRRQVLRFMIDTCGTSLEHKVSRCVTPYGAYTYIKGRFTKGLNQALVR